MKYIIMIVFSSFVMAVYGQKAPHSDLIKPIGDGTFLRFEVLSRYVLEVKEIKVDGTRYQYGSINLLAKVKRLFTTTPFSTFIVKNKKGEIYPLSGQLKDLFRRNSGDYQIMLNVDTSIHKVEIDASILILKKEDHLNRNKFNEVAKGKLIRKSGNTFIDENGISWVLQKQGKNVFHDPWNNVKFLSEAPGGGEYETIRKVHLCEGKRSTFLRVIEVTADTLKGCNILSPPYGGTYNFGATSGTNHAFLDIAPHSSPLLGGWGSNYAKLDSSYPCENDPCLPKNTASPTVFLIDRSGSMNGKGASGKSKWEEAKEASLNSTASILNNTATQQEVAFLTFSGGCSQDPTAGQSLVFSSTMNAVQQKLSAMGSPGGGTPLNEAVSGATQRLKQHMNVNHLQGKPKLIVLSDGAATCGPIRPAQVYAVGTNQSRQNNSGGFQSNWTEAGGYLNTTKDAVAKEESNTDNRIAVKYYTIGFDIKAGSKAERDLQYLASQSGGKYLNTQNEFELTRAFSKFFKVYQPKLHPADKETLKEARIIFDVGVQEILNEDYEKARETFQSFIAHYPNDYHAIFNLALMYEASDYHSNAIAKYEEYLRLFPEATDMEWVLKQIALLQNDKSHFKVYTKKILLSDLAYLKQHFEKIQNGESIALAEEFKGFIQEKKGFYETLPDKLGIINKSKKVDYKEVSKGLSNCVKLIKNDPNNWDTNATSPLSITFFNLQKMIENF